MQWNRKNILTQAMTQTDPTTYANCNKPVTKEQTLCDASYKASRRVKSTDRKWDGGCQRPGRGDRELFNGKIRRESAGAWLHNNENKLKTPELYN